MPSRSTILDYGASNLIYCFRKHKMTFSNLLFIIIRHINDSNSCGQNISQIDCPRTSPLSHTANGVHNYTSKQEAFHQTWL